MASALCWTKTPVYYKIAFTLLAAFASCQQLRDRESSTSSRKRTLIVRSTHPCRKRRGTRNKQDNSQALEVCVCVCATSIYTYVRTCVFVSPSADLTGDRA